MNSLLRRFPVWRLALALAAGLLLHPAQASAVLVVDWGGNYVSGDVNFQTGGFSADEPLILSPAASYNGTSATFYGAVAISGDRTRQTLVQQNSSTDRLQLKSSDAGTGTASYLLLWKQEDFLGGLNTGNVGFTASGTLMLQMTTYANFGPGRIVLRQGSSYYISESVFNAANTTFTLNPTELDWFNYDPTDWSATDSSSLSTIGSSVSLVSGGVIANVDQIGFLFNGNNNSSNAVRIQNFEVNMSAIPEPSTTLLLLGGTLSFVWIRHRRRFLNRNG